MLNFLFSPIRWVRGIFDTIRNAISLYEEARNQENTFKAAQVAEKLNPKSGMNTREIEKSLEDFVEKARAEQKRELATNQKPINIANSIVRLEDVINQASELKEKIDALNPF